MTSMINLFLLTMCLFGHTTLGFTPSILQRQAFKSLSARRATAAIAPVLDCEDGVAPFGMEVAASPALDFAPWLELHHVVFLNCPDSKRVFAVDFTPLDQRNPKTLVQLLLGQNVPAEIRVREMPLGDSSSSDAIKSLWTCYSLGNEQHVCNLEHGIVDWSAPTDEDLERSKKFIERIQRKWSCSMNLYTHNCQHFSWFVEDLFKYEAVCPI